MTTRIQKAIVQIIVSTYNEAGELVNEQPSQPLVIYRANEPDVWVWAERVTKG